MKKLISFALLFALLCSVACIGIYAKPAPVQKPQTDESSKGTAAGNYSTGDSSTETSQTPAVNNSEPEKTHTNTNQNYGSVQFNFSETSLSFSKKITKNNLSLSGQVLNEDGSVQNITDFFNENKASRFDIIDIAYESNIISEYDRISAYCKVLKLKYFENIVCLTGVYNKLYNYYLNENTPDYLKEEISGVIEEQPDTKASKYKKYESSNFDIYYPPSVVSMKNIIEIAEYFEYVRTTFANLGFKLPNLENYLNQGVSKYRVYITTEPMGDGMNATCNVFSYPCYEGSPNSEPIIVDRYASNISINITQFNTQELHEIIAHEYFHAVQYAYDPYEMPCDAHWFFESTASWAELIAANDIYNFDINVQDFLNSTSSLISSNNYGQVLLPLLIQDACGIKAIREIFERYGYSSHGNAYGFGAFRRVFNDVLAEYGLTFDDIFLKMTYYNANPSYWYSKFTQKAMNLIPCPTITEFTATSSSGTCIDLAEWKSVSSYSSHYIRFCSDSLLRNQTITVTVTTLPFIDNTINCQCYFEGSDGSQERIEFKHTERYTYQFTFDSYGKDVSEICVILSNTSLGSALYSITYQVDVIRYGSQRTINIPVNHTYSSYSKILDYGEYIDYITTFNTDGYELLQTLGNEYTAIEVYSTNDTLIYKSDAQGYGKNALLNRYFYANTQYRIRVYFEKTGVTGLIQLAVTPAGKPSGLNYYISSYGRFPRLSESSSWISTDLTKDCTQVFTFTPSSSTNYKISVSSDINVVIYIIDPRKTDASIKDSGSIISNNYSLETKLEANVPYLIICSARTPHELNSTHKLNLKVSLTLKTPPVYNPPVVYDNHNVIVPASTRVTNTKVLQNAVR